MRRRKIYDIRKHRVRYFFDELWDAKWELLKVVQKFAIIGLIGTASYNYLFKNGTTPANSLKGRIAQLEQNSIVQDFKENWRQSKAFFQDIRDEHRYRNSEAGKRHAEEYHKIQQQRRQEMDEMFGKGEWQLKYPKTKEEKLQAAREWQEYFGNDR